MPSGRSRRSTRNTKPSSVTSAMARGQPLAQRAKNSCSVQPRRAAPLVGLVDVDEVDVRREVELLAAELAHAEDDEAARSPVAGARLAVRARPARRRRARPPRRGRRRPGAPARAPPPRAAPAQLARAQPQIFAVAIGAQPAPTARRRPAPPPARRACASRVLFAAQVRIARQPRQLAPDRAPAAPSDTGSATQRQEQRFGLVAGSDEGSERITRPRREARDARGRTFGSGPGPPPEPRAHALPRGHGPKLYTATP